jgi:hypothetical protein
MVLAASLMLGEALGERAAAATLFNALGRPARSRSGTRQLADVLLEQLPLALTNAEFYPGAVA